MNETRAQALERLLSEIDRFDFFEPKYQTDNQLLSDVTSALQPFLQNPERHGRHVAVILEYALLAGLTRMIGPVLRLYRIFFLDRWIKRQLAYRVLQPLQARLQTAKDEVLAAVDPGDDLLPVVSVTTKTDWRRQGRRMILVETRGVVLPTTGMQLRGHLASDSDHRADRLSVCRCNSI